MKQYQGTVVKAHSQTLSVEVARKWVHPIYRKTVRSVKKFQVHDPKNQAQVGQLVNFVETKPISKLKHFILVDKKIKTVK